jgi:hypothetical protein
MTQTKALAGSAIAMLIALSCTTSVSAQYCPFYDTWSGYTSVPVFIHPNLLPNLRHVDGTPWEQAELDQEIRWTLDRLQEAYANLPNIFYAGMSQCAAGSTCAIPGAIHIQPRLAPEGPDKIEWCKSVMGETWGYTANGRQIVLNSGYYSGDGSACNTSWEHWDAGPQPINIGALGLYSTLGGVLQHELLHGLGIHHQRACATVACSSPITCSVAEGGANFPQELHAWFQYDIDAIRYFYGPPPTSSLSHDESYDGAIWYSLPTSSMYPFQHQPDATSSIDNLMYVASVEAGSFAPIVHQWEWLSVGWTWFGHGGPEKTLHRVGTAYDGDSVYVHYLRGETQTVVEKSPHETQFTGPFAVGSSVTDPATITRRHGLESAFDVFSGMRVVTWRATNGQIQLQAILDSGGAPVFLPPVAVTVGGQPLIAFETPSVACADDDPVMSCVLVWASAAERGTAVSDPHRHRLSWMHFEPRPDNMHVLGSVFSSTWEVGGPPRVAFRRDLPGYGPYRVFVVAWPSQGWNDTMIITAFKDPDPDAPEWNVSAGHGNPSVPTRKTFALGASYGSAELPFRNW